jgi:Bacterial regulatory helix-turn-helix protein, lysR family
MSSREPSWDLYRSFRAALEHRSLSGAARALGLTQPTLARHIDELEGALGPAQHGDLQHDADPTAGVIAHAGHVLAAVSPMCLRGALGDAIAAL